MSDDPEELKRLISQMRMEQDFDSPHIALAEFLDEDASELEHLRQLRNFVGEMLRWSDDDETPGRLMAYMAAKDAVKNKYNSLPDHAR